MPDISMCSNGQCPRAQQCYRHRAVPSPNQSYTRVEVPKLCTSFEPIEGRKTVPYARKWFDGSTEYTTGWVLDCGLSVTFSNNAKTKVRIFGRIGNSSFTADQIRVIAEDLNKIAEDMTK